MDKTRKTATIAATLLAGGAALKRWNSRPEPLQAQGMCLEMACLADVDAGRDLERVVL